MISVVVRIVEQGSCLGSLHTVGGASDVPSRLKDSFLPTVFRVDRCRIRALGQFGYLTDRGLQDLDCERSDSWTGGVSGFGNEALDKWRKFIFLQVVYFKRISRD